MSAAVHLLRSGVVCWGAVALSCAPMFQSPRDAGVPVVRVTPDTVTIVRRTDGTGFYVTAIVRSENGKPFLAYLACGQSAQRLIDGSWTTVWTPVCVTTGDAVASVAGRDSLVVGVNVFGFTDPAFAPRLDPRLQPGLYRVAFLIGVDAGQSRTRSEVREAASAPFVVLDSMIR